MQHLGSFHLHSSSIPFFPLQSDCGRTLAISPQIAPQSELCWLHTPGAGWCVALSALFLANWRLGSDTWYDSGLISLARLWVVVCSFFWLFLNNDYQIYIVRSYSHYTLNSLPFNSLLVLVLQVALCWMLITCLHVIGSLVIWSKLALLWILLEGIIGVP